MATANTATGVECNFEFQVTQIKNEIETQFFAITELLKNRKNKLLIELEEIHSKYKRENEKQKASISELEKGMKFILETFQSSALKEIQGEISKTIEKKQKVIQSEIKSNYISIKFDNTLLDKINRFGKISLSNSSLPVVDYTEKVKPVVSVGSAGSGGGQFHNPFGVAVDYTTGNIYVSDQSNRVQVFNKDCNYLFQFGADRMKYPLCIVIHKERVLVSQNGAGCLMVFGLKGNFVKQIGTPGNGERQLNGPRGIAINVDNGDIYACDYLNNRIQIFSNDYYFKSQFGIGIVKSPGDIQLTKDTIFVLSDQNPFLYTFNYNLVQVQNTVCDSIRKHLHFPRAFMIDGSGNFIISNYNNNNVIIFNNTGLLLHKFTHSISRPVGVALTSKGGIIVVDHNNHLLIF